PLINARPRSVTLNTCPARGPVVPVHRTVNTGKSATSRTGGLLSATPIFKGRFLEWFPTFGESWHVVQVPVIAFAPSGSVENRLSPLTPLIVNCLVLKSFSPRATA